MNKEISKKKDFHSGDELVLQYLNNSLSQEETRKMEERISEDQMLVDAIEGLRQIDVFETTKIDSQLKNYIKHKIINKGKTKREFSFPTWLLLSIIILLMLISIGYFVISKLLS